jgi:hypothetical protein
MIERWIAISNKGNERMARYEIHKRTLNLYNILIWKYWLKHSVTVKWPRGWAVLHDDGEGNITSTESADPNDHFRPFLEKYCGQQCRAWEWRYAVSAKVVTVGYEEYYDDMVEIKFRKKADAVHFALKYA